MDFDLSEHWRVILRRKGWALATFVAVLGGVVAVTLRQAPVYESASVVRVASREPMATMRGQSVVWYGMHNALGTEVQLIKQSNEIHKAAAKNLRREGGEAFEKIGAAQVGGRISVQQVSGSDLIKISARGPDPGAARAVANALVETYREHYIQRRTQEAKKRMQRIEDSLQQLRGELDGVQKKIRSHQEDNVRLGTAKVYRNRIADIDAELISLGRNLTEDHPKVRELKSERAELKKILSQIPKGEIDYENLLSQRGRLRELTNQMSMELHAASIDLAGKRESATQSVELVKEAGSAHKLQPNTVLNLGIGALLGAVCAVMMCFLVETMDTSIGRVEDIEEQTGLSVMALIPYLGARKKKLWGGNGRSEDMHSRLIFNQPEQSQAAECYRTLRESAQAALSERDLGNVLMLTSAAPREGKTLTTVNLSLLSVQMGRRVLLLEAEMRNPRIHKFLSVERSPGLSDVLMGRASLGECTRGIVDLLMGAPEWDSLLGQPNIEQLHLLTSGTSCSNPAELIASEGMGRLLEEASESYDMVYVDTPPVMPVVDTFTLGDWIRPALMVYTVGGVSRHLLMRSLKLLDEKGIEVLGIVLNQIESDVHLPAYYRRAYGSYYGYGYGYHKTE